MSSFLASLRQVGNNIANGVSSKVAQYANADFLNAVTAGAAMIVAADGVIEDSEIDEFVDFATTHPALTAYAPQTKIDAFNKALKLAKDKTNQMVLMGQIAAFKDKPQAVVIAELLCLLAAADGNVADAEKKALKRVIGRALGLDADQYID